MKTRIFGIAGYAGSGKDTLYIQLKKEFRKRGISGDINRIAFADLLKEELSGPVQRLYGLDIFNLTTEQKEWLRPLMVFHGEWRRRDSPMYWVYRLTMNLGSHKDITFITDVRYPNEAQWIHNNHGKIIFVQKYRVTGENRLTGRSIKNRVYQSPPNDVERDSLQQVFEQKDYLLEWEYGDTLKYSEISRRIGLEAEKLCRVIFN